MVTAIEMRAKLRGKTISQSVSKPTGLTPPELKSFVHAGIRAFGPDTSFHTTHKD